MGICGGGLRRRGGEKAGNWGMTGGEKTNTWGRLWLEESTRKGRLTVGKGHLLLVGREGGNRRGRKTSNKSKRPNLGATLKGACPQKGTNREKDCKN